MKKKREEKQKDSNKNKIKRKIEKVKRKKYSEENLIKALEAIENGMAKKQAAKQYQVPRATLQFRIKKPDHKPQPGPCPVLNEDEENKLKNWVTVSHTKGFPKRKEDLLHSVAEFVKKTGRPNPFRNDIPGNKWFQLFLKRHPDIVMRTPEAITAASATVSENDIKGWFNSIERYLKDNALFEILSDPRRVLNGDETNFVLCAKTGVVLAPKGAKNVYEVDHATAKTSLTVMFTFAANGELTPPMVIFPYKRLPSEIASKVPSDWGIGLTDNGWMKSEVFSQYIEKVLHPHLVRNQVPFPVILFVDGHKTHLTYSVSELCSSLNIVLIALYPNCTRLLQPADVSAFRPLKGGWQKTVLEWRRDNPSRALTKVDFVPLLQKTIEKCVKPDTIINGFRATGLCPWDKNAIDYSKCLGKNLKNNPESENLPETSRTMTKNDFIRYTGQSTITYILSKQNLTNAEMILKNLWYFFNESRIEKPNIEANEKDDKVQDSLGVESMPVIMWEDSETNEKDDKVQDGVGVENMPVIMWEDSTNEKDDKVQDGVDVANMSIIMCENSETNEKDDKAQDALDTTNMEIMMCDDFDHEVLIEEIIENTEGLTATNDTQNFRQDKEQDREQDKEDCVQITHTALIETYKDKNESTLNKKSSVPRNIVKRPSQQDFDKIEVLETICNPTFTTPIKKNLAGEIKLEDILVLPKTPQRKGVRQTKKTPYVITSTEFKNEERQKIKAKKEKEEAIQKRKEQRERNKLVKIEQKLKKEEKCIKKRVVEKHNTADSAKKILFSKDFTNLNVNIALKNKKGNKIDKKEVKLTPEKDNCEVKLIQGKDKNKVEKEKKEIYKENNSENCPKQSLNFNSIKIKKEECDTKNKIIKKVPNKLNKEETKVILKNILYSKEANTDEEKSGNDVPIRANEKFSITEIEKMLTDE